MLVQNTMTGQLHDVADDAGYGWSGGIDGYDEAPVVYDGFGNPVGFPPLLPILASLAPMVLPPLLKAITSGFKGVPGPYGYADGYEYADELDGWGGYDGYDGYDEFADDEEYAGFEGYGEPVAQQQVLYDGFGNPVGWGPLLSVGKALLPAAAKLIAPIASTATKAVGSLLPFGSKVARSAVQAALGPAAGAMAAVRARQARAMRAAAATRARARSMRAAAARGAMRPYPARRPYPMRPFRPFRPIRRIPPGWRRPAVPYTGPSPSRVYMSCQSWPGTPGLVPTRPGTVKPAAPVRRRRRRRRRRR